MIFCLHTSKCPTSLKQIIAEWADLHTFQLNLPESYEQSKHTALSITTLSINDSQYKHLAKHNSAS
jgi:hypothetical protein